MRFRTLLLGHRDDRCIERIGQTLDRMDPQSRLWTVLSIEAAEQAALWDLMEGRTVTAEHFVPAGTASLQPVTHHGKNSLPLFSRFQKRFCRQEGVEEVWGYNHQTFSWLTGPGYFVGRNDDGRYVLDYTKLPPQRPEGWPTLRDNDRALARPVFGGLVDEIRGVSEHVCIGRAARGSTPMDSWFVLCRDDANTGRGA